MNKKNSMSFKLAYLCVGIIPMLLGVMIIAMVITGSLRSNLKDDVKDSLRVAASQLNEYFKYDVLVNGKIDYEEYADHEYIESLQKEGIELTLFEGDTRFITSLKKDDGSYNEGSKAAADIYAEVKSGKDYTEEGVMINGTGYFVYYEPIYDGNKQFWGMAFAGKPEEMVKKEIQKVIALVAVCTIGLIVVLSIIIIILANKLAKTLAFTSEAISNLADGNLDTSFDSYSFINEFNGLVQSGDKLQKQLLSAVGGAKNTSSSLSSAVATVDELSANSAEGTSQIARAVSELATTAQSMAETVQEANATVIDMGESIDRITSNVSDMNKSSEASMDANKTAMEYMGKLTEASNKSAKSVETITVKIAECSESAEKIKTATDAITEISSQTNLLSLNASIEAARAGESGRGFAVVAGEIQKLAEQSSSSATEIQSVIDEILDKVKECVAQAAEMTEVINDQVKFLNETSTKINAMSETGRELAEGAKAISGEAKSLNKLKEIVLASISDLSAISEENAASSQEVTASVDNIASAVESTKEESETMRQLAEDLSSRMEFFKM